MANEPTYLTAEGAIRLKEELRHLTGPARDALAARLRAAIQQGDLSENADYSAAKEDQAFLEGRIQELQQILSNAVIIDEMEQKTNEVGIGSTVTVQEDDFPPETYFVVGPKEANPTNGRISHASPIGKALIGHKAGDTVIVTTPGGEIHLKITEIK
jgi:transcription elongation factor GreA